MGKKIHILKTWMGVTSGTLGGRDDGYPELKMQIITDPLTLTGGFGKQPQEKYYTLTETDVSATVERVREERREEDAKKQREKDEAEFERLRNKLGR